MLPYPAKIASHAQVETTVISALRPALYLAKRETAGSPYPIAGDVRGTGLILGVEFVADQASKRPFSPEAGVARRVVEAAPA